MSGPWNQGALWSKAKTTEAGESSQDRWCTPRPLFEMLDAEFDFGLDAAAVAGNSLCGPHYLGPDQKGERADALSTDWASWTRARQQRVWCNPPYSQAAAFAAAAQWHATQRGVTTAFLVFARTDTKWWWERVLARDHRTGERTDRLPAAEIRWAPGRLSFIPDGWVHPDHLPEGEEAEPLQAAPAPSVLIVWRPRADIDNALRVLLEQRLSTSSYYFPDNHTLIPPGRVKE